MARSETRVQAGAGPPDLRDVILLSSSPVLPPARLLTTVATTETSRPAWRDRHFDLPLLSSDPPEAATRSGPSAGDTHSKYFANSQTLPSSQLAATTTEADLPPIPKEKPAKYMSGDLESALQRRRDWTPPPIDTVIPTGETSRVHHHPADWSSSPGELVARSNNVFKSLQTSYGCKEGEGQPSNRPATTTTTTRESSFTKRKAIEAISIGDAAQSTSRETSPTKSKAPKKKTRTLTELAVAAYADPTVTGDGHTTTKTAKTTTKRTLEVLDENLPMAEPGARPGLPMSKLRKLKSARATAAAKKPRGKKAPAVRKPILLSPESARDAATRQDFLFGTSSQLATEQSPTFLRHLHTAMHTSNRDAAEDELEREPGRLLDIIDEFEFDSDPEISMVDLTGQQTPAPLIKTAQKKQLWGAAARGEDGLLRDNVIDLEDAIEFPEDPHQVIAMAQRAAEEAIQKEAQEKDTPALTLVTTATQATQRGKGKQPAKAKAKATEMSSTAPAGPTPAPAETQKKETKASKAKAAKAAKAAKEKEPPARPNFDILSTAQLTKKVSDYGYKTIKARSAMISLLNECWDAQHPNSVPAEQPAPVAPSSTAPVTAQTNEANTASIATEPVKTPPKPKAPRVTKPKATAATQPAASIICSLTTSPRAALFLPMGSVSPSAAGTAAIHTTAKVTAKATAKSSAKATASTSAKAISQTRKVPEVFEIDDSESDGRFSSPEPINLARAVDEDVDIDIDIDEDNIVATDLDEDENNDMDNDGDEADMSLADAPLTYEESELFRYIATAVTSAPMTNDPTAPSWHEKILMYDTIILETFTAWLNDGPLRKAGYAGVDVLPGDVKKWCESKSVCCTWRKNLQGKERKW